MIDRARLQERFALSSTPIRDALSQLRHDGLVEIRAQSRTQVTRIDSGAAARAMILRRALDLEIAEMVVGQRPSGLIEELGQLIVRQREAVELQDRGLLADLDNAFHLAQYRAVDAGPLWDMTRSGDLQRMRRLMLARPGNPAQVVEDHEAIVDGYRAGDSAAVRQAIRHHLDRSHPFIAHLHEAWPEYFRHT